MVQVILNIINVVMAGFWPTPKLDAEAHYQRLEDQFIDLMADWIVDPDMGEDLAEFCETHGFSPFMDKFPEVASR